jgi:hypothetical protein
MMHPKSDDLGPKQRQEEGNGWLASLILTCCTGVVDKRGPDGPHGLRDPGGGMEQQCQPHKV